MSLHFYDLFGLRVGSEIELPELFASEPGEAADVRIRRGAIPNRGEEKTGINVREGGALLCIPNVGRYWMADGAEIVVEADPAGSERNVRLYLLGSAFAAILHQRGLLPLHANAVEVDGRAIAFMGHPGAGKSTLAAWFHDRGFRILSDDVCVVTFDEAGRALAHPGIPRLRLWREALEATGRTAEAYELSFDDMDKYNVPTAAHVDQAIPLSHVYLLEKADGEVGGIDPLTGSAAVEALVANTYRGAYLPLMKATQGHLFQCARLANRISIFRAGRAWGFAALDSEARMLEAHARRIARILAG
jgi:hypothetical protein